MRGLKRSLRMSIEAMRVYSHGLSRPLKHLKAYIDTLMASTDTLTASTDTLTASKALNWLVIGNSQVLSHGCERVVEAVRVLYTHSSATVS